MSYERMLYGAALSGALALVFVLTLVKERRPRVLATCGLAAFLMPLFSNLILRNAGATSALSHDLPFKPFPVSWQDTGSGVFTLAGASVALSLGVCRTAPAVHVGVLALLTAFAALLVDIYFY
jgi:hypothetical protein